MRIVTAKDAAEAAATAASFVADTLVASVAARSHAGVAFSGGRTPWLMLADLAGYDLPWHAIDVFQVDERVAPAGDESRNLTQLRPLLPAGARLVPMDVADPGPARLDVAAQHYAALLPEQLDLVHLGLGADGHIASLVPGSSVLDETDRLVAVTPDAYQGQLRMTLTYPALRGARKVLFLVTGADKAPALRRLLAGDRSIPAGRLGRHDAVVVATVDALGDPPPSG